MKLVQATEQDNEKILHYFSQTNYPGPIQMRFQRMFNFFNQYRIQSENFITYLLLNEKDEIEAMASMIFREGYLDGEKQTIGYATDLRVSSNRRAILAWSQHFLPVLETERKKRNCKYIFSVVAHSQRQAYNAFIRPRNFRRNMPRYYLFRRFQLVTIHGLWPFHEKPLRGIKIRSALSSDMDALAAYVIKKTSDRPIRYFDSVQDFRLSLERWQDMAIENFLLAFDKNENLIGCTAPWNPERVQRVYPTIYGPKAKNLAETLQVLSWLGIAHPLPAENQEFQMRYLTHLYADNPDIFYSLIYNSYQQAGKKELLVYPHFEGELQTLPPRSFIAADMNYGLYCILGPNDANPEFLKPKALNTPPVFEPAFI